MQQRKPRPTSRFEDATDLRLMKISYLERRGLIATQIAEDYRSARRKIDRLRPRDLKFVHRIELILDYNVHI